MPTAAFIQLNQVSKRFGDLRAVLPTDLELQRGEIFSILGPSGCGKTTLLRMLAGFVEPDSGCIIVDGEDVTRVPPNRRPIHTVFQNYALFPHMTVRENIAFGLRMARRPAAEIRASVDGMLELIQMTAHADKRPTALSGGQKQRAAIARALVNRPRLLLLDEPLAALDLKLRQHMLLELELIHDEVGTTFLYVTHDQGEAMGISDRIAVMHAGRIEQIGSPAAIYETPASRFVADFIGDTNILDGDVVERVSENYLRIELDEFGSVLAWNDRGLRPGDAVHLSIRPEKFELQREQPQALAERNALPGRVVDRIYLGSMTRYRVAIGERLVTVQQQHSRFQLDQQPPQWDETVWVTWHADDGYMILEQSPGDSACAAS
jgi:spermidine/putrescine transport system ATP-binding protein